MIRFVLEGDRQLVAKTVGTVGSIMAWGPPFVLLALGCNRSLSRTVLTRYKPRGRSSDIAGDISRPFLWSLIIGAII